MTTPCPFKKKCEYKALSVTIMSRARLHTQPLLVGNAFLETKSEWVCKKMTLEKCPLRPSKVGRYASGSSTNCLV
jgi:hypothetical protein